MDMHCYERNMATLDDRFRGGKALPTSTVEVYYQELKRIPNEAFERIVRRIIKYNRTYPTPGDIDEGWRDWQRDNPDKMIRENISCQACQNRGYFDVEFIPGWIRESPNFETVADPWQFAYDGVCNCAHCKVYPFAKKHVSALLIDEIEHDKYMRLLVEKRKPVKPIKNKEVLVDRALPGTVELTEAELAAKERLAMQYQELKYIPDDDIPF